VVITWTRQNEQEEAATNNTTNDQAMTGGAQGRKKKRKKPYSMLVPGRSVQTYLGASALCLLLMNLSLTHRSHITHYTHPHTHHTSCTTGTLAFSPSAPLLRLYGALQTQKGEIVAAIAPANTPFMAARLAAGFGEFVNQAGWVTQITWPAQQVTGRETRRTNQQQQQQQQHLAYPPTRHISFGEAKHPMCTWQSVVDDEQGVRELPVAVCAGKEDKDGNIQLPIGFRRERWFLSIDDTNGPSFSVLPLYEWSSPCTLPPNTIGIFLVPLVEWASPMQRDTRKARCKEIVVQLAQLLASYWKKWVGEEGGGFDGFADESGPHPGCIFESMAWRIIQ
jgi:hypothetical protein